MASVFVRTVANMFIRSALLSLSALAAAKEMPKDEIKAAELYDSGIRHANNVALKKVALPRSYATGRGLHSLRNIGRYRRLRVPTTRRSMLRSRRGWSAETEPPSRAVMSSVAATLVLTPATRCCNGLKLYATFKIC